MVLILQFVHMVVDGTIKTDFKAKRNFKKISMKVQRMYTFYSVSENSLSNYFVVELGFLSLSLLECGSLGYLMAKAIVEELNLHKPKLEHI